MNINIIKKQWVIATVFFITAHLAYAAPAFYVGGSTGLDVVTADGKTTSATLNYRGLPLNLLAGYGGNVSPNFYLAGEATVRAATLTFSDHATNALGIGTSYGYGLSVLPGAILSDNTMAFARVGIVWDHFRSYNTTKVGGQFGLGLQTSINPNLDLRGEYDYIGYNNIQTTGNEISPNADQFLVGLVYKFE